MLKYAPKSKRKDFGPKGSCQARQDPFEAFRSFITAPERLRMAGGRSKEEPESKPVPKRTIRTENGQNRQGVKCGQEKNRKNYSAQKHRKINAWKTHSVKNSLYYAKICTGILK